MKEPFTQTELAQFSGTTTWYRHPLFRSCRYTDGVQYIAEKAGAYWLIEMIFALQYDAKVGALPFQYWVLQVREDQSAILRCEDGNNDLAHKEAIPYTDFPPQSIAFYFTDSTLLLPSEY